VIARDSTRPPFDRVRAICLALTGVSERQSHGEAAWFTAKGRAFVTCADRHHDDRVAIWLAAAPGAQETLVASNPTRFFRPPYYGVRGWLGVYLDVSVDWAEIEALVADAHRLIAGRRP
jgi:hypothetical protein